jgi:hypothetical protein
MSRASAAVTAGLTMTTAGVLVSVASTFRLAQMGLFGDGYLAFADLDFEAVAFAVLGVGLVVAGLSLALVGVVDRTLGALPPDSDGTFDHDPAEEVRPATAGRPATLADSSPIEGSSSSAPSGPGSAERLRARGAALASGAAPLARSSWERVRTTGRTAGDGVRRASTAAAAIARENSRNLGAARETARENRQRQDIERERASAEARARFLVARDAPASAPATATAPVTAETPTRSPAG